MGWEGAGGRGWSLWEEEGKREKGPGVAHLAHIPGRLGFLPLPMLAAWGQHRHVPVAL